MSLFQLFRERIGTPDSFMYDIIFFLVRLWQRRKMRIVIDDAPLRTLSGPYVLLSNHESFFDFYYISQMKHPRRPTYLVNEYYCTRPILKTMAKRAGILSKKLFTKDLSAPVGILRSIRMGYPVVIFPEGRLSPDGRSNPIVEKGAAFYKKLGCDLVLVKIDGAYFASPKWRKRSYRSTISIKVKRVITKEELRSIPDKELETVISSALANNASSCTLNRYSQRKKAKGLETLLYRCADCGTLYSTRSVGCELYCSECGMRHRLNEQYHFSDSIGTIAGYYDRIAQWEKAELDVFSLHASVRAKIFGAEGGHVRTEKGECMLKPEGFSYQSEGKSFFVPMDKLPALAFSCGKEFELYLNGELHYFYPLETPQQVARWALLVDLMSAEREELSDNEA